MPRIEMYTQVMCPYCDRAKALLKDKGVSWDEIDVTMNPGKRSAMKERAAGKHTVPQIFIDDHHVGGCDELYALEKAGRLDPLLAAGR